MTEASDHDFTPEDWDCPARRAADDARYEGYVWDAVRAVAEDLAPYPDPDAEDIAAAKANADGWGFNPEYAEDAA